MLYCPGKKLFLFSRKFFDSISLLRNLFVTFVHFIFKPKLSAVMVFLRFALKA